MDANRPSQFGHLREILDFAIDKEQEAIDLYTRLAATAKWEAIANELRNIAAMEISHKRRLQSLDLGTAATTVNRPVVDMKIADYLVEAQPSDNMTWQDILNIAMKRELAAMKLYEDLAAIVVDPHAQQLFRNLSAEESKHKLYFEGIWDKEILQEN